MSNNSTQTQTTNTDHQFQIGNQLWRRRTRAGLKPKYENPEELEKACMEYFEWVESNPLYEDKVGFYEGSATHEPSAKMRAMTIAGLCLFIGISQKTFWEWKKNRDDLSNVLEWAEENIRDQKFAGAAAGLLNASIISRDLGLAEKSAVQQLDRNGEPTDPTSNADEIAARVLACVKGIYDGE